MVFSAIPQVITEDRASGAQFIDGSLNFDKDRLTYLTRTPGSSGNRNNWTISCWIKRGKIGVANQRIFESGATAIRFGDDTFQWIDGASGNNGENTPAAKIRDTGWYHLVFAWDSSAGVYGNRIYVNGVELDYNQTGGSNPNTSSAWNTGSQVHTIGRNAGNTDRYYDGMMTQCYFIDGQTLGPGYFGFTDPLTGTWRPKKFEVEGTTANNGTTWSNFSSDPDNVIQSGAATELFNGNLSSGGVTLNDTTTASDEWFIALDGVSIPCKDSVSFWSANGAGTATMRINGDNNLKVEAQTTTQGWWTLKFNGTINKIELAYLDGGSSNTYFGLAVDGVTLRDGVTQNLQFGTNGFYLPMDGNTPIGKDQSGRGNDWTPIGFGSNSIDKATGARPILNTGSGGKVATLGVLGSGVGKTYTVTAAGGKFYLDGSVNPALTSLVKGATYKFDTSDSSNNTHPFIFGTTAEGANYSDGVARSHNDGTNWALTFVSSSGNFGVGDANTCFDGDITTRNGIDNSSGNGTLTLTVDLKNVHKVEVLTGIQNTLSINGGSVVGTASADPEWVTYESGTAFNLTTITIACAQAGTGGYRVDCYGIKVDNVLLVNNLNDRYTKITVPHNVPNTFYYHCGAHSAMGNSISGSILDETKADPYAWKCVLALPLVGKDDDESKNINCTQSVAKAVTANGNAVASNAYSNFYGGSYYFDGNGDSLTIPASSDFNFGGGDYTIEWWMYWENRTGYQSVYDCGYTATNSNLIQSNTGTSRFIIYAQGANVAEETTNAPLKKWIHYAFVRNGNNVTLYRDGSISYAGTHSGNTHGSSSSGVYIGSDVNNYHFEGNIQDFRIYKGVAKYTSEFIPASTNPDILPDTPSGITGKTNLTKITEGAVTGFESNSDYLALAASSDFEFTGDHTIEMFIYHNTLAGDSVPYATGGSGSPDQLYINTAGSFYYAYGQTGNINSPAGTIVVGKWQHIAVSKQGTNLRMFVDGKIVASSTNHSSTIGSSSAVPHIGMRGDGNHFVEGFISNLRIVKGTALYTADFTPPTEPLTTTSQGATASEVKLLCCQSTTSATAAAVAPPNEPFSGAGGAQGGGTTSDYLKVSSVGHSDFSVDGDFTFEWWHYRAAANVNNGFMWTIGDSNAATGLELYWGSGGSALKLYTNGGPNSVTATAATGWHHYAVVRNGTGTDNLKVYYDGTEGGSFTNTNTFSGEVRIGAEYYNGSVTGGMIGPMSQFRFVKGSAVYTSNFTAPTTALTAITNTKILTLQGDTITDASGTNKVIQVFGNVNTDDVSGRGNAAATNFNPFNTDINIVRGQETGYCTANPLDKGALDLSNGNLRVERSGDTTDWEIGRCTIRIPDTGRWYWEMTLSAGSNDGIYTGVGLRNAVLSQEITGFWGYNSGGYAIYNTNYASSRPSMNVGDTACVSFDRDNNKMWVLINGAITVYEGNPYSGTDPNSNWRSIPSDVYPVVGARSTGVGDYNFGQKPFKFPPPDGFQPLNLSTVQPEKVIARPDQYVGVSLWTGNGTSQNITGLKHKPDLVWSKARSFGADHELYDSVRGTMQRLYSSLPDPEGSSSSGVNSFNADGFGVTGGGGVNNNTSTYVGWTWKAGGNKNTFNIDDVGYANASDVNMNVGGARGIQNVTAGNDYQGGWAGPSAYWASTDSWSNLPVANDNTSLGKEKWDTAETLSNGHTFAVNDFRQAPANGSGGFVLRATTTVTLKFEVYHHITEIAVTDTDAQTWGNRTVVATNPSQGSFVEATGKCFWFSTNSNVPNVAAMGTVYNAPAQPTIAATGCSVGTKQGFSVIKYQGGGGSDNVPHGLTQPPDFVLVKQLNNAGTEDWNAMHSALGATHRGYFNTTASFSETDNGFGNVNPTSLVFTVAYNGTNKSGSDYIAYLWHDVPGLQKFGSYENPSSTEGAFVELGFKPAVLIYKCAKNISSSSGLGDWIIVDTTRSPVNNPSDGNTLVVNESNSEDGYYTSSQAAVDILSNGFKIRHPNSSPGGDPGRLYIYAAWAEAPSFNLYGAQSNAR